MSRSSTLRCVLLCALGVATPVMAAPPSNDDWSSRISIDPLVLLSPGGFSNTQGAINEATTDPSDPILPCKNGDVAQRGNTVWYGLRFSGAGQNFHINLSALGYDSVVAIYTGTPGSFSPVVGGCNDDGAGSFASAMAGVRLVGDTDYSIMVARPAQNTNTAALSFSGRSAPIYNVTKLTDTADGTCDADCSLREAISASNANPGAVLIPAGDYSLTRTGNDNANASGDLDLTSGMALYGAGASTRIIGISNERVIDLDPGNSLGHTFQLRDLVVRGGGGSTFFGFGAGISASSGGVPGNEHLALYGVEVRNNTSQLAGGGVRANGPTVVIDSIIADNTAASDGGGLSFGGDANTRVDVAYTTITGNSSTSGFSGGGGGLHSTSNTFVYNSTISGNSARNNGGGILSTTASGRMNLIGVTVSNNRADADGANGGNGGGLRIEGNFASVANTVFAGNVAGTGSTASDCDKSPSLTNVALDSNHLEAAASSCGFASGTGDVLGAPALLGALANNGGRTPTQLPQAGSPVLDSGSTGNCLNTDQRGITRPRDGNNSGTAECDKGAVEVDPGLPDPIFSNGFES